MKACVCCGKLSVLVNGSTTEEVNISRGLKQSDPLAPFLFLLVSEGLCALSQKAVSLGFFKGFQVSSKVSVSLLQYAYDTLFIGEAHVENLWAMKAILRWYELVSGLKVNFSKSRLIGVNVDSMFMEGATSFLNCTIDTLPFEYLGLPIGANPRLSSTWDPVVKTIEKHLSSWKNRFVSLGGSVVLINSVLASIPVFYLSFLKLPLKVRKAIVRIQRNFLWGGMAGVKDKIPWVSWKDVCRPKSEGGIGVRDLKWFNVSLLAKWRWRLLRVDDLLWKRVLEARYGVISRPMLSIGRSNNFSIWWKDLVGLGVEKGRVAPLKEVFPRLYSISLQSDHTIQEMGEWVSDRWIWHIKWRRIFFTWEEEMYRDLRSLIGRVVITKEPDSWSYVNGDITSLGELGTVEGYCLFWQALLGRLPIRANLAHRGIITSGPASWCPWWFGVLSVMPATLSSMGESFLKGMTISSRQKRLKPKKYLKKFKLPRGNG
ncbi:hypothetical protein TSUD_99270 [Trifolium subterraneum]|uniref:Reverse transcriptase domain-containing protein n=1 Tax=Trifolium subterraneum TaxID=3900 RepID=A0A2Z6PF89_TRISU|nr:hypothetical protein TSUD_99270 [Trifolium subterraneum]